MFVFSMPVVPDFAENVTLEQLLQLDVKNIYARHLKAFHSAELPLSLGIIENEESPIDMNKKQGIIGSLALRDLSAKEPYFYVHTPSLQQKHKDMSTVMTCLYGKLIRGEQLRDCPFMQAGVVWPKYTQHAPEYLQFHNFTTDSYARTGFQVLDSSEQREIIADRETCAVYLGTPVTFKDFTPEGVSSESDPLEPKSFSLGLFDWD
jgi:hypothetical protein